MEVNAGMGKMKPRIRIAFYRTAYQEEEKHVVCTSAAPSLRVFHCSLESCTAPAWYLTGRLTPDTAGGKCCITSRHRTFASHARNTNCPARTPCLGVPGLVHGSSRRLTWRSATLKSCGSRYTRRPWRFRSVSCVRLDRDRDCAFSSTLQASH